MNWARFWGVFFCIMTINFIFRIVLKKKGVDKGKIGLVLKLVIGSLPLFLFMMWNNDTISINGKIINSFIGFASIVAGVGYLYIGKVEK